MGCLFLTIKKIILLSILLFLIGIGGYLFYLNAALPDVQDRIRAGIEPTASSRIFAKDGSVIRTHQNYHYKPLPLSEMPEFLVSAMVATEDRRFFDHHGVDLVGIFRALWVNLLSGELRQGGSSLTQQLAKNIFLSNDKTLERKLKETLLAFKLERELTKSQLLELYLNYVYFGEGAYGVGAASEVFFGKEPQNLTLSEIALLVGLPQAPTRYNPYVNLSLAKERRSQVLHKLLEASLITEAQLDRFENAPVWLNPSGKLLSRADKHPYFNRMVLSEALSFLNIQEDDFWASNFRIYTTLDPVSQRASERSIRQAFSSSGGRPQVALLMLDGNGRMLAYIGGRGYSVSQFDRVSLSKRNVGSLIKPFVYTVALEKGMSPKTVYYDEPVQFNTSKGVWQPKNYDASHKGYLNLAQALAYSNNIIAVKLMRDVTPDSVIKLLRQCNIRSQIEPSLSLALGSASLSLSEITAAYQVFQNGGYYYPPYAIEAITDSKGNVLYQHQEKSVRVISPAIRDTMVRMLSGVLLYGTGKHALLPWQAAGKTGTSDDHRDAWFVGFTSNRTLGVWLGNDDNAPMSAISGGGLPAIIWRRSMLSSLGGSAVQPFSLTEGEIVQPQDYSSVDLAYLSPTEKPVLVRQMEGWWKNITEPFMNKNHEEGVFPDKENNAQPNEGKSSNTASKREDILQKIIDWSGL
ncbi:MAG: PBP1A family penicillin-binding protein [Candidatus Melainabacteria bacterium]|nr:PBP1A family penicillin-binding protein [Candidatus Melainabacteria bacterium]